MKSTPGSLSRRKHNPPSTDGINHIIGASSRWKEVERPIVISVNTLNNA